MAELRDSDVLSAVGDDKGHTYGELLARFGAVHALALTQALGRLCAEGLVEYGAADCYWPTRGKEADSTVAPAACAVSPALAAQLATLPEWAAVVDALREGRPITLWPGELPARSPVESACGRVLRLLAKAQPLTSSQIRQHGFSSAYRKWADPAIAHLSTTGQIEPRDGGKWGLPQG